MKTKRLGTSSAGLNESGSFLLTDAETLWLGVLRKEDKLLGSKDGLFPV